MGLSDRDYMYEPRDPKPKFWSRPPIQEPPKNSPPPRETPKTRSVKPPHARVRKLPAAQKQLIELITLVVFFVLLISAVTDRSQPSPEFLRIWHHQLSPDRLQAQGVPQINTLETSFPPTGGQRWFIQPPTDGAYGTLSIVAPPINGKNYIVEVANWESSEPAVMILIPGGDATYVNLPLGRYRLIVSEGAHWYGYHAMFGPDATTEETTNPISIYRQEGTTPNFNFYIQLLLSGTLPSQEIPTNPSP